MSDDSDRLRQRLHEQVANVPVAGDLEDVAARIGSRRFHRVQRLSALVVAALVIGGIGGFAAGHVTRGGTDLVTVGGATDATDASGASGAPSSTAEPTTTGEMDSGGPDTTLGAPATMPVAGGDQPADVAAARAAVEQAFGAAFDGDATNAQRVAAIQDGAGLTALFDELRNGPVGPQVLEARTVVESVVFVSRTAAAVKFHSALGAGKSGPYLGDAILTAAGWQVAHASYCTIAGYAGVHCPV